LAVVLGLSVALAAVLYGVAHLLDSGLSSLGWNLLASIGGALFAWLGVLVVRRYEPAPQYSVALIGFPRSGKTTLIVSLFGEMFAGQIGRQLRPSGESTINRVNELLAQLQMGRALGPTEDQDRFAFRSELKSGRFPFSRMYKVEFGDFPGSDSVAYLQKYGPWLHTTEFFKWVVEADALVFVVDVAEFYRDQGRQTAYVAEMSSAIRAAWQHYVEANKEQRARCRRVRVVLVFTKADLLGRFTSERRVVERIGALAFGETVPELAQLTPYDLQHEGARLRAQFTPLLNYMESELGDRFSISFVSPFGSAPDGSRLGMKQFAQAVLPR